MTENIFAIICIVIFFIYLFYLSSNKEHYCPVKVD